MTTSLQQKHKYLQKKNRQTKLPEVKSFSESNNNNNCNQCMHTNLFQQHKKKAKKENFRLTKQTLEN